MQLSFFFLVLVIATFGIPIDQFTALIKFGKAIGYDFNRTDVCGQDDNHQYFVGCQDDAVSSLMLGNAKGTMPKYLLTHLPRLFQLGLGGSINGTIKSGVHVPPSLAILDISGSGINSIDFNNDCKLRSIRASSLINISSFNCRTIESIDFFTLTLPTLAVKSEVYGVSINLHSSNIGSLQISSPEFVKTINIESSTIKSLQISGSSLGTISLNGQIETLSIGDKLIPVAELQASGIQLKKFKTSAFFKKLNLSGNNLTSFEWNADNGNWFDLSNNLLTEAKVNLTNIQFAQLEYCNLSGNKLTCPVDPHLEEHCYVVCD